MAQKFTYKRYDGKEFAAYQEGPLAVYLDEKGWCAAHIKSQRDLMGFYPFKQKRDALLYVKTMLEYDFDWDFKDKDQMFEKNDRAKLIDARNMAKAKVDLKNDA